MDGQNLAVGTTLCGYSQTLKGKTGLVSATRKNLRYHAICGWLVAFHLSVGAFGRSCL